MLTVIKLALGSMSLTTKLVMMGSVVGAILIAYGVWHAHVYNKGWNAALQAVARQDKKAVDRAKQFRSRYRECVDAGGVWDQSTGECGRR